MNGPAVLAAAVCVTSGLVAGVLFAVALSVLPALCAMPPDRYLQAHRLLGRNWDPTMPVLVLGSFAADLALAAWAGGRGRPVFAAAAVLLLLVSVISHFGNVPINRRVKGTDPAAVPADWHDPRPLWRRWHLLRTVLAAVAAALNAAGLALL
ncbi:anthrone oxygenase family protein [Streptomyces kronopolitis]|uniref:anthrone oxygenase family protein n=1 Tax=Streptomyces kronopolitis TaxID=1612435 RepID=UPI00367666EB